MHAAAWAGPGSTGGGLTDANGDLLDFGEMKNGKTDAFDPVRSEAFQKVLVPLLKKLNEKVPGSAKDLLVGLPPNMEWFLSDLPIASSSDECKLFKDDSMQVAKQVDGELGISRQWLTSQSLEQQAGLMLHELIMYSLKKAPTDCATRVRRAVRAIFSVDRLTEEQLQSELARIEIVRKTKTQSERIITLALDIAQSQCGSGNPVRDPFAGFVGGENLGTGKPAEFVEDIRLTELSHLTSDGTTSGWGFGFSQSTGSQSAGPLSSLHCFAQWGGPNPPQASGVIADGGCGGCQEMRAAVSEYSREVAFPAIQSF